MTLKELLGPDGLIFLSGVVGATVGAIVHDGNNAAKLRIFSVGSLSAYFFHPLALPIVELAFGVINANEDGALPLSGFIAGGFGVIIFETIKAAITLRKKEITESKKGLE